jgi:hypothetical protein
MAFSGALDLSGEVTSMRKAISLAAVLCLGGTIAIQGAGEKSKGKSPAAKPAQPVKSEVARAVETLIRELGHSKYRTRENAQKKLAKYNTEVLPILLQARKKTADLEVIRRLDGLIPNLERTALLKPTLVTLHVDKKPFKDVLAALSKETGYGIDMDNNANNDVFTFHFDKKPFWEVLDKISKEAKLSIYPYNYYGNSNDRIRLVSYGSPPGPHVQYRGSFRFVPTGFNYQRNINFTASYYNKGISDQRTESLTLNFTIHAELKLPFLQVGQATVKSGFDEKKRSMAPKVQTVTTTYYDRSMYSEFGSGQRSYSHSLSVNLVRPSRDSKTAKLIQGEIPVLLLSKQTPEIVIDNIVNVKKRKFQGRRTTIDIDQVTAGNNWGNGMMYQIQMSVKEDSNSPNNDYAWANSLQHRLELMDAKGNKYWTWNSNLWNRGARFANGSIWFRPPDGVQIGPPVKLVYNQWTSLQHTLKFEFKDLPLP